MRAASFDHLVGAQQNRLWDDQAQRFRRPEVQYQFKLRWQFGRQVSGSYSMQHLSYHSADLAIRVEKIWPICHQSPDAREFTKECHRRKLVLECKVSDHLKISQ